MSSESSRGFTLRISRALGLLLFALALVHSYAASPGWHAQTWHVEEGLPDNRVVGLAQLSDGYLCVGTREGIVRFNGANFENVTIANPSGVSGGGVRAMFADSRGDLWVDMFRETLVRLGEHSISVFTGREGVPIGDLTNVADDGEGHVWVEIGGRTCVVEGQKLRTLDLPAGVFARDARGQLWYAAGRHIGLLTAKGFEPRLEVEGAPVVLTRAAAGGLWICAGQKLLRLTADGALAVRHELTAGIHATCLLEDRSGAVWIGTTSEGLLRFDGTAWAEMETSHHSVTCLLEDREGNIWMGSAGGGVNRLRPRTLTFSGPRNGSTFESLGSVCEDSAGRIWTATTAGQLARSDQERWTTETWAGQNVSCVAADLGGNIWVGTRGRGLMQLNLRTGERRTWRTEDGLPGNLVRSLFVAADGSIWIATEDPPALCQFANGRFERIQVPADVRTFRAIAQDAGGRVWIGTSEGRIFRVAAGQLVAEPLVSDESRTSVRCVHASPDGSVWIGYAGRGVGWLKNGRYTVFSSSNGLIDDTVWHIVSDQRGAIWVTGPHGLSRVAIEDAEAVAAGRQTVLRPTLYGRGEGYAGFVGNYNNVPTAARGRDGRLFFATSQGLLEIDPAKLPHNPLAPPVMLERIVVDDQLAAIGKRWFSASASTRAPATELTENSFLRLPPDHRRLAFDFAALSYAAPENVRYRYRLENFDNGWTETASEHSARYSRLPAGAYRFRVVACNDSGVWNNRGASVAIVVDPFFWQTWWFRLVVIAAFTTAVVVVVRRASFRRLQVKLHLAEQQAALSEERARIAQDIHDDLGGSLAHIKLLSESAAQDQTASGPTADTLRQITGTVRHMLKSLDEIVWAINPRNDTLPDLISYLGQYTVEFLRAAGIRCEIELPDNPPEIPIRSDVRHHVFLVVKETLTNVVRHAAARRVRLDARLDANSLIVTIEDDGHGFDATGVSGQGDGLQNMRARMKTAGGTFELMSTDAGTRVELGVAIDGLRPGE